MTYRSLVIEEHPDRQSAARTYVAGENAPKFCTLNAYTWPAPAWKFAEENKLEVSSVNNCWLRLPIDGPSLRLFLAKGVGSNPEVGELLDRVNDAHWYVINDEEF